MAGKGKSKSKSAAKGGSASTLKTAMSAQK